MTKCTFWDFAANFKNTNLPTQCEIRNMKFKSILHCTRGNQVDSSFLCSVEISLHGACTSTKDTAPLSQTKRIHINSKLTKDGPTCTFDLRHSFECYSLAFRQSIVTNNRSHFLLAFFRNRGIVCVLSEFILNALLSYGPVMHFSLNHRLLRCCMYWTSYYVTEITRSSE